jgi:hypothetical protein
MLESCLLPRDLKGRLMENSVITHPAHLNSIGLIMLNLDKALREVLCWLCFWLHKVQVKAYSVVRMTSASRNPLKGLPFLIFKPLAKFAA